jgi:protoheme IX farnesyltransferase
MRYNLRSKLHLYWKLIKSLQTGLLLFTGLTGYMSCRCPVTNWQVLLPLTGSLFLAISGSTVLNMWYDRDIDKQMSRTCNRPLPTGQISSSETLLFGLTLIVLGVIWAVLLDPLFGIVVFAGIFFDVLIYTMWLKRRTCWSIVWGGIAGGMPILAGRVLGIGGFDWIGIALALSVLFWIPTHIMTFNMRYADDYNHASIPTFPNTYGNHITRIIIAISSVLAALSLGAAAFGIGLAWGFLRLFAVLSIGLFILALLSTLKPSEKINFGLFKFASLYLFGAMLILLATGI